MGVREKRLEGLEGIATEVETIRISCKQCAYLLKV